MTKEEDKKLFQNHAFFLKITFLIAIHFVYQLQANRIMLNPTGDASCRGRSLHTSYERSQTSAWANAMKKELEKDQDHEVVVSHKLNEKLEPLQAAQFSNRLSADLFVSLHLYKEQKPKPQISIFYLVRDPSLDFIHRSGNPLDVIPLHRSHLKNIHVTRSIATKLCSRLKRHKNALEVVGAFGLPFAPHTGVLAPAIAIEAGICQDDAYKDLTQPCTREILEILKEVSHESSDDTSYADNNSNRLRPVPLDNRSTCSPAT